MIGKTAFQGTDRITINPAFFQRLDAKIDGINDHGLIAAPVMLWTLTESDPGQILSEEACIRLARYQQARWGAHQVVWFLGGDGRYYETGERWRRIGRAVFGDRHDRLVTMHPCGQYWPRPEFAGEPWFDFIGYQSGHGDSDEHLRWLVEGPPASDWDVEPRYPIINLEPNYEIHPAYHSDHLFTAYEVRRASYWSLLVSPTAGVTYGHNAIWVWRETTGPAEGHEGIPSVPPWHEGVETDGINSLAIMREGFFNDWPWWQFRPAPDLLTVQPGEDDPRAFVAAARTVDNQFSVLYLPLGGTVNLDLSSMALPVTAHWASVVPNTFETVKAGTIEETQATLTAPDERDWLLSLRAHKR